VVPFVAVPSIAPRLLDQLIAVYALAQLSHLRAPDLRLGQVG
jgi:hypothetical protein